MAWNGRLAAEMAAAIASVLGLVITLTMLPETKGKSLEELSAEEEAGLVAGAAASSWSATLAGPLAPRPPYSMK